MFRRHQWRSSSVRYPGRNLSLLPLSATASKMFATPKGRETKWRLPRQLSSFISLSTNMSGCHNFFQHFYYQGIAKNVDFLVLMCLIICLHISPFLKIFPAVTTVSSFFYSHGVAKNIYCLVLMCLVNYLCALTSFETFRFLILVSGGIFIILPWNHEPDSSGNLFTC